ncbi:hypothetical protein ACI3PL_25995, partial [Lacticaseibacillus paracasei]
KFQLAMYAVIIKSLNPKAKFVDLQIIHTGNKTEKFNVDLASYLPLVKAYFIANGKEEFVNNNAKLFEYKNYEGTPSIVSDIEGY